MIDIRADLQRAFDEGYKKGKAEMYEHMKNRLDDEYDAGYYTGKADRPSGEWLKFGLGRGTRILFCTSCERRIEVPLSQGDSNYNYCPNCGAKMDGERKENE